MSVNITVYQYRKNVLYFFVIQHKRNKITSTDIFRVDTELYEHRSANERSEFTNATQCVRKGSRVLECSIAFIIYLIMS